MTAPANPAAPKRQRTKLVVACLLLATIPIIVAMIVGTVGRSEKGVRENDRTAVEGLQRDEPLRWEALAALGVVGLGVAGCVAAPFVLNARRRTRDSGTAPASP